LWRYSRHPTYFFEWLQWWAYVLIGHIAPLTLLGPAVMLVFLFRLTGIPHTERQALRTRGDKYRAYQRTTSAFFPWPPRREAA
jgi:steroid 5-alpha reductase family enzyme